MVGVEGCGQGLLIVKNVCVMTYYFPFTSLVGTFGVLKTYRVGLRLGFTIRFSVRGF